LAVLDAVSRVYREAGARATTGVSVIVPALNEAEALPETLASLARQSVPPLEVLVVDGGSTDDTAGAASRCGARVLHAPAGRGRQLHAGALASRGSVFLFLHADTRLPPDGIRDVLCASRSAAGGKFRLAYDRRHPLLRAVAHVSRYPWAWTSYGDSAFFATRAAYERIGGFEDVPLFEDVRFYRQLRGAGRVAVLPSPVVSSSRRFLRRGPARQLLANAALVLLHRLGVPPAKLARFYAPEP